jgi:hypothetical protein
MKHGYRIRRVKWHAKSYMKLGVLEEIEQYHECEYGVIANGGITKHTYMGGGPDYVTAEEVLADDWELITTGIRKEFSKHEHGMEYDDDTDWDNYVSPKGGWGDFDDDEE